MKLTDIVQFIQLNEDGEPTGQGPVELKDIVKAFPSKASKAIDKLWGGPRLVYHGMQFFDGDGLGLAYEKAEEAAKAEMDDHEVELSFHVGGTDELDMDDYNFTTKVEDAQECYLGYDPKHDVLYIGYDAWLDENDFNEKWDDEFKKATGKVFDMDDEEHQKVFDSAWEEWKKMGGYGMLFRLTPRGKAFSADVVLEDAGGFYRGIYRGPAFKRLGLIDVRLD